MRFIRFFIVLALGLFPGGAIRAQDDTLSPPENLPEVAIEGLEIKVPEAFELANILLVVSDWGRGGGARNFFIETPYYREVQAAFGPYRDHPVFARLNTINFNNFNDFVGFRENSFAFHFEGDRLIRSATLDSWWNPRWLPNHFLDNLDLIEDFARASNFRAFYSDHRIFYQEQTGLFKAKVSLPRIYLWLEGNFETSYNSIENLFSPLIRGNHSSSIKEGKTVNTLYTAVAGPEFAKLRDDGTGDLLLMRQLFTEIDHGYVDPASVRHIERIRGVFSRPEIWYGDPAGFYADPFASFNEYMTWSAVLLFIRDTYSYEAFEAERAKTTEYMEKARQFIAFGEFYAALEGLYLERNEQTLEDLYPAIMAWAEEFQAK